MIHRRFIHFDIGLKEILQNTPELRWILCQFCHVLNPQFFLRERIHDPVSVTRIAFNSKLKISVYRFVFFHS